MIARGRISRGRIARGRIARGRIARVKITRDRIPNLRRSSTVAHQDESSRRIERSEVRLVRWENSI